MIGRQRTSKSKLQFLSFYPNRDRSSLHCRKLKPAERERERESENGSHLECWLMYSWYVVGDTVGTIGNGPLDGASEGTDDSEGDADVGKALGRSEGLVPGDLVALCFFFFDLAGASVGDGSRAVFEVGDDVGDSGNWPAVVGAADVGMALGASVGGVGLRVG